MFNLIERYSIKILKNIRKIHHLKTFIINFYFELLFSFKILHRSYSSIFHWWTLHFHWSDMFHIPQSLHPLCILNTYLRFRTCMFRTRSKVRSRTLLRTLLACRLIKSIYLLLFAIFYEVSARQMTYAYQCLVVWVSFLMEFRYHTMCQIHGTCRLQRNLCKQVNFPQLWYFFSKSYHCLRILRPYWSVLHRQNYRPSGWWKWLCLMKGNLCKCHTPSAC